MEEALKTSSSAASNDEEEEERKETEKMYREKIDRIIAVFDQVREKDQRRRPNPPDWAIDGISFQVMVDPVIVSFFSVFFPFSLYIVLFFSPTLSLRA